MNEPGERGPGERITKPGINPGAAQHLARHNRKGHSGLQ